MTTLVLLAAGLGQRFGGNKQVTPLGPSGEWVIDYTIYDAWRCGINRVLVIVNSALSAVISEHLNQAWASRLELIYVEQTAPRQLFPREKPWGTGQALLCAADQLTAGPFIVANGDDFYGQQAIAALQNFLNSDQNNDHAVIGYNLSTTLSPAGGVSRALCRTAADGYLTSLEERHQLCWQDNVIVDEKKQLISANQLVSMNLFGFTADFLPLLAEQFTLFVSQADLNAEFYLPVAVGNLLNLGLRMQLIPSQEQWFGVTYAADRYLLGQQFQLLRDNGGYPSPVWTSIAGPDSLRDR